MRSIFRSGGTEFPGTCTRFGTGGTKFSVTVNRFNTSITRQNQYVGKDHMGVRSPASALELRSLLR